MQPDVRRARGLGDDVLLHLLVLSAALVVLLYANRHQWFFGDEWDFLAERGLNGATRGLFVPHNEHWSTLPILVYRGLLHVVGLHHYWPYVLVLVLLHLLVTHLLWRQVCAEGVRASLALLLTAVFAVLGAGSENLLWAFQIGFVGSVAFGWLETNLQNRGERSARREIGAQLCAVVALMCSGVGVVMVAVATLTTLLRRGWRAAAAHAAGPALVFATWYVLVGREGVIPAQRPGPVRLAEYVAIGLTHGLGQAAGWTWLGASLLSGLLLGAWRLRREVHGPAAAAYAGAAGAVLQFTVAGLGRAGLGLDQAEASRYAYIGIALLLPLVALVLEHVVRGRSQGLVLLVCLALLLPLTANLRLLRATAAAEAGREQGLRLVLLSARDVLDDAPVLYRQQPEPLYSPNLSVQGVRELSERGWLPSVPPSLQARLTVRANLQTAVATVPAGTAGTAVVTEAVRVSPSASAPGCLTYRAVTADSPQLVVETPPQGASIVLSPTATGNLLVFLSGGRPPAFGSPAIFRLQAGTTYELRLVASDLSAILTLPPGRTVACAAGFPGP